MRFKAWCPGLHTRVNQIWSGSNAMTTMATRIAPRSQGAVPTQEVPQSRLRPPPAAKRRQSYRVKQNGDILPTASLGPHHILWYQLASSVKRLHASNM